jgi:uncharacterized protein (DUF2267 family)
MSQSGLEGFDVTMQKTHVWLKDLQQDLGMDDQHKAYQALRAVLHALRDRLPVTEVAQLGAQLPLLLRGMYYESWKPAGKPRRDRHKEAFLNNVRKHLERAHTLDAETIARGAFRVLARHLPEAESIKRLLPAELRRLWPIGASDEAVWLG